MGQEKKLQEMLYNDYWFPMEQSFNNTATDNKFDDFMRNYLTVKLGRIPIIKEVYKEFKKYFLSSNPSGVEKIVSDISYYANFYVKMAFQQINDKQLDELFKDIESLRVWVAFPFFLELYSDYDKGIILRKDIIEIVKTIESYVFRRLIVGIPTNSLNKTFANLYKNIDKTNYLESFHASLQIMDSYRRFPTDDEFMSEILVKDVYNMRSRTYILRKLENYDHREKVTVEDYTIEHIMPQNKNLSKEWQNMLGINWKDVQKKYLHTIGNLTLTGYNSELSDRPFLEKRDMKGGFKDSHLRLNDDLANLTEWNESKISDRAISIAEKAIKVWQKTELPESILAKYQEEKKPENAYSIVHFHNFLQGEMLDLFNAIRTRILNLDASVREEYKKLYIAYKTITNFVDIIPQKSKLLLVLNMNFDEINDPKSLCRDITNLGRWGNGNVESGIENISELDDVMFLIEQSYHKHADHNGD